MSWQLQVLGAASLSYADKVLHPERKTMGVLGYLALEGATSRSKLAGLLWSESDERTARNNLVQVIRRLKKSTNANLILGDDLLSLSGDIKTDAAELKILAFAGDESLLTFTGELLSQHDYDDCPDFADWLFSERERILDLRQNTLKNVIGQHQKASNYQEALRCAEALLSLDSISEEAHRLVMRLHFLSGDRGSALKAFERCKEVLEKELGVEPSTDTHQLAAEIEFGSLLPVATKAKADLPLRVLRLPLIGREKMLADMEAAWDKSLAIILRGEPGAGKSRLLKDFLESKGAYILFEGRPGDSNVSYSTQSRILRQVLSLYEIPLESWQRKELSRLLPELGETPEPLTSETDQLRFYEAQASVFQSAFEKGMRVIAIDDLQFFDEASFKSLYFILGKHWGKPNALQTVLSFRRGELHSESETSLKDMVQAGSACLLEVSLLNDSQVQELISSLGIADIEPLQKTLHSYTGGNPLFMIETIKSLLESDPTDRTFRLPSSSKVQTLLQQRLEKLSQSALRLAWTAAVAQTDFSLDLASHVTQQSVFDLAEPFSELEQRSIFTGQRFSHDLIFEAALASISAPVKTYLHRQMAQYLEKQQGNPARIAQHYLSAGHEKLAAPYLVLSAKQAISTFRYDDAFDLYIQVSKIFEHNQENQEAFNVLNLALELADSSPANRVPYLAKELTRLATQPLEKAIALRAQAAQHELEGNLSAAEQAARKGLQFTADAPYLELAAQLRETLAASILYQGRADEALVEYQEAYEVCQKMGPGIALANAASSLAIVLDHLDRYLEASHYYQRALNFFETLNNTPRLIQTLNDYGFSLRESGKLHSSLEVLSRSLELLNHATGIPDDEWRCHAQFGATSTQLNHFQFALEHLLLAQQIANRHDINAPTVQISIAHILTLLGQFNEAQSRLDKVLNQPLREQTRGGLYLAKARLEFVRQGQVEPYLSLAVKHLHAKPESVSQLKLNLLQASAESPKKALEFAKSAHEIALKKPDSVAYQIGPLTRLAQIYLHLEKTSLAMQHSKQAIELIQNHGSDFYQGEVLLTHYQALTACKDKTAQSYLRQTLTWLIDIADNNVPSEYRESFLNNNPVNKVILGAARLEGLLKSDVFVL